MAKSAIPKKPLAVSRVKKKLPLEVDWGNGIPKDRLRYINAHEEALIKAARHSKAKRTVNGVVAYADDSSSSKGVERGGVTTGTTTNSTSSSGGGLGQGGQGAGGTAGSSSGSSSAAKASTTPSSSAAKSATPSGSAATTPTSGSSSPNAAAQAAANMANGVLGASRPTTNAAAGSSVLSRGPNPAANAAFSKLNATAGALSAAQNPSSIQGMINSGVANPVSYSGQFDNGFYHQLTKGPLPGESNPNTFSNAISRTNMVNAAHVPMDQFSNGYNPNKLTAGAQKIHQAIVDNALRTNTPVDFFSGARTFNPASPTKNHPSRQAIDIRIMDPVTGRPVGYDKIGEFSYNPIGSVNTRRGRTESVAKAIQNALSGPYRDFATGVINSFMDNPGVYGDFNNQRWGGSFGTDSWRTNKNALDYMHFDEGKVVSGVSPDQSALRKEARNYAGPRGDVQLADAAPPTGLAATAPPAGPPRNSPPTYQTIPSPTGMNPLGNLYAGDPRVGLPQGGFPAAPPAQTSSFLGDPRVGMPLGGFPAAPAAATASSFLGDPRVGMPLGGFPAAPRPVDDVRTVAPGHWKHEEDNYLSQLGVMDKLKHDPTAMAGYEAMQNPDGSGLKLSGTTYNPGNLGDTYTAPDGSYVTNVSTNQYPTDYAQTLVHELGHIGSRAKGTMTPNEEIAQRLKDFENYNYYDKIRQDAGRFLESSGIRSPRSTPNPRDYAGPNSFRQSASGTYTAPYDNPTPPAALGASPPRASQNMQTPPGWSAPSAAPPANFPGVSPNVPRTYADNGWRMSNQDSWNPQVGPGDEVQQETPTYDDSPSQGSVSPSQEGPAVEDPGVTQQRQKSYAMRGSTIGGIIAGPLGSLIGGTLGYQMGKTSPEQRRSIASSPQALNANVQSINKLAEERGGKGNPSMRVTPQGFKDVLTNPQKVTKNPKKYTSLEQMLALLAQGIDPTTGKKM